MKATSQYLQQYAEPEARELDTWPRQIRYDHVVVIPAFDETRAFIDRLSEYHSKVKSLLLVTVVNRPDHVTDCPRNDELLRSIELTSPVIWQQHCLSLHGDRSLGILCVDRHHSPIPQKQGVGLARKIGCDIAACLIHHGFIGTQWIHSTDADAFLPEDYFGAAHTLNQHTACATYAFTHRREDTLTAQATALYEQTLYDYVEGLDYALSPYAFHTIGSILLINAQHYCQARGFPKRAGGEDFYLLNKLAKLGAIESLQPQIELEPRLSHRVPFGTGPATAKIQEDLINHRPTCSYDRRIFELLKQTLATFEQAIDAQQDIALALQHLPSICQEALSSLNVEQCLKHLQQQKHCDGKKQHFHWWLDAFRTLKFLRFLQANGYPQVPISS